MVALGEKSGHVTRRAGLDDACHANATLLDCGATRL